MHYRAFTLLLAAAAIAGCTTGPGSSDRASLKPSSRVAGQWMATDGVAMSSFSNSGRFSTTLRATGETVTEGTYVESGDRVALDFYSVRQQRQSKATCNFAGRGQLNCVSDTGAQFTLVRNAVG
ncbi:hypothetical protein B7H23_11445 [Notoacmeibacter marinus]|uniref:Outer membrane lipoprotein n=1 Tax=Notoacmeibacter marinus TaxID=1876515 RepID=A0A231UZD7_9HYPH|nr:hypothetical protein [Notoacmeibacter marinus]OXT00696.1 hypothetical protein B7H23_11445 [Notoacmeibacter marinus]